MKCRSREVSEADIMEQDFLAGSAEGQLYQNMTDLDGIAELIASIL